MFITTAGFKSLIKEAYKNGRLVTGATQEEYLFEGSCWVIRVDRDSLPKKEKAAVVELTGELPSPGEVFRAAKGQANQYEMQENEAWDIGNTFDRCREEMTVTVVRQIICTYILHIKCACISDGMDKHSKFLNLFV